MSNSHTQKNDVNRILENVVEGVVNNVEVNIDNRQTKENSNDIFGFDINKRWDYENGFHLTCDSTRFSKMLAHYELYKSITHLPGAVVECGVYKGASLLRFASFRDAMEHSYSRKIIGFDAFGKFPHQKEADDAEFIEYFENAGGEGISIDNLEKAFKHKGINNYEFIKGDITQTVPAYTKSHDELKIALLHIDVDVYQPTVTILENMYERVVNGGIIMFDDYGTVAGETRAVDEFFDGKDVHIEKLSLSHVPAFIRKKG